MDNAVQLLLYMTAKIHSMLIIQVLFSKKDFTFLQQDAYERALFTPPAAVSVVPASKILLSETTQAMCNSYYF